MAPTKYPNRIEPYRRLIDISRNLVSTLDRSELLMQIITAAVDLSGAEAASILLYDDSNQELIFECATNLESQSIRGSLIPMDFTICGWVISNKQPIIINSADEDVDQFDKISQRLKFKIKSIMEIPMITKLKVVGIIEVINKIDGPFDEQDLDLINALSGQAAIAIENSRLFQQSDLIAELVHELRTPMASLNTAIHLLVHQDAGKQQQEYLANMIQSEIARLSELTTSFLDLARMESGRIQFNPEELNLERILVDCTEMMRARAVEKNLDLVIEIPPHLPSVRADAGKIKQVVINLLSNAIKYNFPGGKIEVKGFAKQENIGFSITDTGPGISQDDMPHIFEKFYRVPGTEKLASGTGLGLSICKRIIDAHHGSILVDSIVGKGSVFSVYLPLKNT